MKQAMILCLMVAAVACKAKEDNQAQEIITASSDSIYMEQAADSVSNVRQDGTKTSTGSPLPIKQQLPAALEVYLDQHHGLWRYPTLRTQDMALIPADEQGPFYLVADFNKDQQEDYAVQIVEQDSAAILAIISHGKEEFKEFVLEKHLLKKSKGEQSSSPYLTLAKNSAVGKAAENGNGSPVPQDGIIVKTNNSTVTYVFAGNDFQKY